MTNITLTVSTKVYEQSAHGVARGFAHMITYVREGTEQVNNGVFSLNTTQYSAIDDSLALILRNESSMYRQSDVIIEGATIPASLKTFLIDKYSSETPFSSITFA